MSTFFPPQGERPHRALEICSRCPVRAECLDFALWAHTEYGVFGGMTPDERKRQR
jgi:WhiB family redox-sensing transcriptional regulator